MSRKDRFIGAIEMLGDAIENGSEQDKSDHWHDVYIKAQNLTIPEAEI